tara:strand:+ start:111 stop:1139 length:1029 start_codon:yes stop_codon:yes gene_type:complete
MPLFAKKKTKEAAAATPAPAAAPAAAQAATPGEGHREAMAEMQDQHDDEMDEMQDHHDEALRKAAAAHRQALADEKAKFHAHAMETQGMHTRLLAVSTARHAVAVAEGELKHKTTLYEHAVVLDSHGVGGGKRAVASLKRAMLAAKRTHASVVKDFEAAQSASAPASPSGKVLARQKRRAKLAARRGNARAEAGMTPQPLPPNAESLTQRRRSDPQQPPAPLPPMLSGAAMGSASDPWAAAPGAVPAAAADPSSEEVLKGQAPRSKRLSTSRPPPGQPGEAPPPPRIAPLLESSYDSLDDDSYDSRDDAPPSHQALPSSGVAVPRAPADSFTNTDSFTDDYE